MVKGKSRIPRDTPASLLMALDTLAAPSPAPTAIFIVVVIGLAACRHVDLVGVVRLHWVDFAYLVHFDVLVALFESWHMRGAGKQLAKRVLCLRCQGIWKLSGED
eukprot:TRINITY_DN2976_c0_g1_i4.p3 TRINITY_DN2976_c0_g1~~TRINITY_DN2976_c0_g1_i4.p3  ORF type:complete len:105 (+),score=7.96 TRINITY_DN2976_c0_g1_i4:143-457(+)